MVRILLFAGLKDLAKRSGVEIPWRVGLTVGQVRHTLVNQIPSLEPLLDRSKAALGDDLVNDDAPVPDQSEIAFLPPVSGGSSG